MAVDELSFDPKDIAQALRKNVESYTPSVEREEVGRVVEAGDGIARVQGLPGAMASELLEFPGGVFGLAMNLEATIEEIHGTIHAHPTLSEALGEAALASLGKAIHI